VPAEVDETQSLVEPILVLKDFDLPDDVCCNICRSSWTRLMQMMTSELVDNMMDLWHCAICNN